MKNLLKILLAVVALAAYSCTTDTTEDLAVNISKGDGLTTVTLSLDGTRTHLGAKGEEGYPLYWSKGDKIALNGVASAALGEEADGQSAATFTFEGDLTAPYNIVYPAPAEGVTASAEGLYPVVFPASQVYTEGGFANGAAPLYGYAGLSAEGEEVGAIEIGHLTGVLRFAVKGDVTLRTLTITTEKGCIAGTFDVDCSSGTLTAQEGASNTVTMSFGDGLALNAETATPIYVTVPAGDYGKFYVMLSTTTDIMKLTFDSTAKPVKAGVVREFAEFSYAANVNENDIYLIDSKEALIHFAEIASNFPPYTTAKVVAPIDMTGEAWTPIEGFGAFIFDGGEFEIKGLSAPLFGSTAARIKNVKLTDVAMEITEGAFSGSIACQLHGGLLENCSASGTINVNNTTLVLGSYTNKYNDIAHGGLVGYVSAATVTNCTNDLDITITSFCAPTFSCKATVGGIVGGCADNSSFTHLTNDGNIEYVGTTQKQNIYISGILGKENSVSGIKAIAAFSNCTNNGAISTASTSDCENALLLSGITGAIPNNDDLTCDLLVNNGAITHSGVCANVTLSGMTGYISKASFTNCRNTANLLVSDGATTSDISMGGLMCGEHTCKNVNNCSNSGDLSIGKTAKSGVVCIGGLSNGTLNVGTFSGCSNTGNITIASEAPVTAIYAFGGVSHVVTATTVEDCTNSGSITVGDNITCSNYIQIGGLLMGLSGMDDVTPTMTNCSNSGALKVGNVTTTHTGNSGRIYMAGLIATINAGNISKCYNEASATITATPTSMTKEPMIGGLFGYINYQTAIKDQVISVTDCENKASIHITATKCSNAYVGGVVGQAWAEKTDETIKFTRVKNSGVITFDGKDHNNPFVGGIWAHINNYSTIELEGCENSGDINYTPVATSTNKPYLGGIVGHETNKASVTIKNCTNKGAITNTCKVSAFRIGGILGSRNNANSKVTIEGCTNLGTITAGGENAATSVAYAVGGIIGYSTSAKTTLKNCINGSATDSTKGAVTLGTAPGGVGLAGIVGLAGNAVEFTGCKNYGHISQTGKGGYYVKDKSNNQVGIGGILGQSSSSPSIFTNCENYGLVEYGTTAPGARVNVGGILGINAGSDNSIVGCKNGGTVAFKASSSSYETTVAGIVAMPTGGINITNCVNLKDAIILASGKCSSNYDIGGVAGGPNAATVKITYCKNYGTVKQTTLNNGHNYIGGVVGYAYTFGTIQYCSNHGAIETAGSSSDKRNYVGGVIGYARQPSKVVCHVKDCYNDYPLVFSGEAGTYCVGGVFGVTTHEEKAGDTEYSYSNCLNLADLTCTGKTTGTTLQIGGIVGLSSANITNCQHYGKIKAIGQEGKVGMIIGQKRDGDYAISLPGCKIGGALILAEETIEEEDANGGDPIVVTSPILTPITADNWLNYIYCAAVSADIAQADGNELLTEKPTTPVYTYPSAQ